MGARTCTSCAGTGHPVIAVGSGLSRDYGTVCTSCSGTGQTSFTDSSREYSSNEQSGRPRQESARPKASGGSVLRVIFGIGGFLMGLGLGATMFPNNAIAIFIVAAICAWLCAALYKVLIGLALVTVILAALLNGNAHAAEQRHAPAAKDISEGHRDLFRYALSTLPNPTAPGFASALRSRVALALYAMDRASRNELFTLDVGTLTSTLRSPSAPIEETRLVGDWDCRRSVVGSDGVNVSDYFPCTIRKGERCTEILSQNAPDGLAGCLYPFDDRHMAFASGVLSAANSLNLRMIEPRADGIVVYDFLRKKQ